MDGQGGESPLSLTSESIFVDRKVGFPLVQFAAHRKDDHTHTHTHTHTHIHTHTSSESSLSGQWIQISNSSLSGKVKKNNKLFLRDKKKL